MSDSDIWFCSTFLQLYVGWKVSLLRRQAQYEWFDIYGWRGSCSVCGKDVQRNNRSIDHIIPISVCLELELYGLVFDHRNMRRCHQLCNTMRSSNIDDLPQSVINKLAQLQAAKI